MYVCALECTCVHWGFPIRNSTKNAVFFFTLDFHIHKYQTNTLGKILCYVCFLLIQTIDIGYKPIAS